MGTCVKKQSGFVLMEFLIVLAVMGIFGSIAFSIGKRVMDRVYSFADTKRLEYLVAEYTMAINSGQLDLTGVKNTVDFAVALARAGGPNEVSAYQSQKRSNKQRKEILINGEKNPDLKEEDFDFMAYPVACCNLPADRMPLFFSRGLRENGVWSKDSLYGTEGGLIAFADGHVETLRNAKQIVCNYLEHLELAF